MALKLSVLFLSALHISGIPSLNNNNVDPHNAPIIVHVNSPKPRISFSQRNPGTFKLTVFSDVHYGEDPDTFGPEQDWNSSDLIERILQDERPDFAWVFLKKFFFLKYIPRLIIQGLSMEIWLLAKVTLFSSSLPPFHVHLFFLGGIRHLSRERNEIDWWNCCAVQSS